MNKASILSFGLLLAASTTFANVNQNVDKLVADGDTWTDTGTAKIPQTNVTVTITQTGGTINLNSVMLSDGTSGSSAKGILELSGGSFTATEVRMTTRGEGIMNISGNADVNIGTVRFAYGSGYGYKGTINLNGGSLTVGKIINERASVDSTFNFNGGTLVAATGADANFFGSSVVKNAVILVGGANINSNGNNITIGQTLSGSGNFTKQGAGILTLSAANSYSGDTIINEGILVAANVSALGSGNVTVSNKGILEIGNGIELSGINDLTVNLGTLKFATISSKIDSITGTIALNNATLDLTGIDLLSATSFDLNDLFGQVPVQFNAIDNIILGNGLTYEWSDQSNGIITVIPEPSTYALCITGAFAVLLLTRRRFKK